MRMLKRVETFNDKYPLVGPEFWMLSVQYFLVQFIATLAWVSPFSLSHNPISDLGNTACGFYSGRLVCSPLHMLMNASFVMLGCTIVAGSILIYQEFKETEGSLIGFGLMGLAGIGSILVGLFPENTIGFLHSVGALLPFLFGNLALVVLGFALDLPKAFKFYTILSGLVGLTGMVLFTLQIYAGLGEGGMERIAAYPQTIWLIAFGIYMMRSHYRSE